MNTNHRAWALSAILAGTFLGMCVGVVSFTSVSRAAASDVVIFLTEGSSWTVPQDWDPANNTIEVVAGGGGGGALPSAMGGANGAYASTTNVALTPGSVITYAVGAGGVGGTASGTLPSAGGSTYLCSGIDNCSSVNDSGVVVGALGGIAGTNGSGVGISASALAGSGTQVGVNGASGVIVITYTPLADTIAPSAPGMLSATPVSSSRVDLAWASSTDNNAVAGYQVFRNSAQVATTTATLFSDLGLLASTTYNYLVKAFDAAGNFSPSSAVSATTQGASTVVDAKTMLSSFWEMDVRDGIAWDYKGQASGMYVGKGLQPQTSIFGSGHKAAVTSTSTGGMVIPSAAINTNGSFTFAVWVRHAGSASIIGRWNVNTVTAKSFSINYNSTTSGRPGVTYYMQNGTTGGLSATTSTLVNQGELSLVWFAYDATTGAIKVTNNGNTWSSIIPSSPFVHDVQRDLEIAHTIQRYGSNAVVGRMMYWKGYVPTDAERAAIYNGGLGQPYTYFDPAGFTPPQKPLTVSLVDAAFANDATLGTQQGLYWLRPFPLKDWSSALAGQRGDYVWVRSTDHGPGAGGMYLGYSSSPMVLPSSWSSLPNAAQLSAADPVSEWGQTETPHLEYNPDTQLYHLYAQAICSSGCPAPSYPFTQATHVWTSPDLVTWTWRAKALSNATGRNHTGYATPHRVGPNNWVALSLLTDSAATPPALTGTWRSTDGISWTLERADQVTADNVTLDTKLEGYGPSWPNRTTGPEGTYLISDWIGTETANPFEQKYPTWRLFSHDGTGTNNDWLQDVRVYREDGTVYIYAKWRYKEPATTRLFVGTLAQ